MHAENNLIHNTKTIKNLVISLTEAMRDICNKGQTLKKETEEGRRG